MGWAYRISLVRVQGLVSYEAFDPSLGLSLVIFYKAIFVVVAVAVLIN